MNPNPLDKLFNEIKMQFDIALKSAIIDHYTTILNSYDLTKVNKQSLRQVIKAEKKLLESLKCKK